MFFMGTLLTPEWVVFFHLPDDLPLSTSNTHVVHYRDSQGVVHTSYVDKLVCTAKKFLELECNFQIVFAHLRQPIYPNELSDLDTRSAGNLNGKRAIVVGHIREKLITTPSKKEALEDIDFPEFSLEWFEIPKVAAPISLESTFSFGARISILKDLDNRLNAPCSIDAVIPYGKNLSLLSSFDLTALKSMKRLIGKTLLDSASTPSSNILKLREFLASETTHPSLANRVVFESDKGIRREEKIKIVFPDTQEGDGIIEPMDVGTGVYTIDPSTGKPMLSGVVVVVLEQSYNQIDVLGTKSSGGALIIPTSHLWKYFEEMCLDGESRMQQEKSAGAKAERSGEKKPTKHPATSGKQKSKGKKKKRSNPNRAKIYATSPSAASEEPQPESSDPTSGTSSSENERSDTLEVPEIITLPSKEPKPFSFKERLGDTRWIGITTKQVPGEQPYKEFYSFIFGSNGSCLQHVGLVRHRAILGNHVSRGSWCIEKNRKQYAVRANLSLPNGQPISFKFLIKDDGSTLSCHEVRTEEQAEQEALLTGKQRTNLVLKEITEASFSNPLSLFTPQERHQGIVSDFAPWAFYEQRAYQRYGVQPLTLEDLGGIWMICGIQESETEVQPFRKNVALCIRGAEAVYKGVRYDVEMTTSYDIADFNVTRPAYSLHLKPKNSGLNSTTLAIYQSQDGRILLATSRIRGENPHSENMTPIYPSKFFARQSSSASHSASASL
jgi:hypothetical protein